LETVSKYHKQAQLRLQNLEMDAAVKNALNTLLLELEQRMV